MATHPPMQVPTVQVVKPSVALLNFTRDAAATLRTAKSTRLTLSTDLHAQHSRESVMSIDSDGAYPPDTVTARDLDYISRTIKSSWEFVHYVFLITNVSRSFTHQFVRTRTASFAQQTQRTVNLADGETFGVVLPRPNSDPVPYVRAAEDALKHYVNLINNGVPPEDARAVLPTMTATNILVACNLRTLADWTVKRGANPRVQEEYRTVVRMMTHEVLNIHPWTKPFLHPDKNVWVQDAEAILRRAFPPASADRAELTKIINLLRGED